jgi:hypothetical protein
MSMRGCGKNVDVQRQVLGPFRETMDTFCCGKSDFEVEGHSGSKDLDEIR